MIWRRPTHSDQFRKLARGRLSSEGYDQLFVDNEVHAIPPDFSDLWLLKEIILAVKPGLVLEYGSGYSTYVIAKTLQRIGKGHLLTIELGKEWLQISSSRLPPDLLPIVEFITPDPVIRPVNSLLPGADIGWYQKPSKHGNKVGIATIAFPAIETLQPDLILLDGPDPSDVPGYSDPTSGEVFPTIVSDPLIFERRKQPVICVDGRRAQCSFLDANLLKTYNVTVWQAQLFTCFFADTPPKIGSPD